MNDTAQAAKAQDPWIGARGRIGVVVPSTNIAVEYDLQRILPEGISWHVARFFIEVRDLSNDDTFLKFVEAIQETIPLAMRDIVTAAIAHLAHSTPEQFRLSATDFNSYVTVDIAAGAPQRVDGRMAASSEPGLGIEPHLDVLGEPVLDIA